MRVSEYRRVSLLGDRLDDELTTTPPSPTTETMMSATHCFPGKSIEEVNAALLAEELAAEAVQAFKGHAIADLRKVMDKVKNPENWKGEWAAAVPHQIVSLVMAAVEFFHGDRAVIVGVQTGTGKVLMRGKGYQC